jgi:hypothetical protein
VAFALAHRITPENIPLILSAISWPITILAIVIILRDVLGSLISRINKAAFGGENGACIEFNDQRPALEETTPEVPREGEATKFKDRIREKVANTYWVASDLVTLFDVILRGGKRGDMLGVYRQVNHHLKELQLDDTPIYKRFRRLYDLTEKSLESDWSAQKRIEVAREVNIIMASLGGLIEKMQPGYRARPGD